MKPILNNICRAATSIEQQLYLTFELDEMLTINSSDDPLTMRETARIKVHGIENSSGLTIVQDLFPSFEPTYGSNTYKVDISGVNEFANSGLASASISLAIYDATNTTLLSEWSNAVLFTKLKTAPVLNLVNASTQEQLSQTPNNNENRVVEDTLTLIGKLDNNIDTDTLLWYKIYLEKETADPKIQQTTEKIYLSPSEDSFTVTLNYPFLSNGAANYSLKVLYSTSIGYVDMITFPLKAITLAVDDTIEIKNNGITVLDEDGVVRILLDFTNTNSIKVGKIVVLRSDSKNSFVNWSTLSELAVELAANAQFSYTIQDNIVESGVGYKYKVYMLGSWGVSNTVETESPIWILFDNILLASNNAQLRISYNPDMSGYKYNINDTITQTIGSVYPFFRRNGLMKYRTFSIGGLISYHAEKDAGTGVDIYNDSLLAHQTSSEAALVNEYNNSLFLKSSDFQQYDNLPEPAKEIIKEKVFREKVLDFLFSEEPKIFRSTPEGNILVKLSGISLSPQKALGRNIYSFSATATEIDSADFAGYKRQDLYNVSIMITESSIENVYNEYLLEAEIDEYNSETVIVSQSLIDNDSIIIHKNSYIF